VKFSRLERLYQTPKKWKLAFQKYKLSNLFFKLQLQKLRHIFFFSNFNLQIISSKSNLRYSFANLFNFKFSKTWQKSLKLYKWSLTNFQKWVWRVDFERFFLKKKVLCFVKWAKTNAFSSIGKMKADKTAKSFPTYRILVFSKFDSLDPTYQTSKKQEFDRLEKNWQFYQPSSCLSKKSVCVFAHFTMQKT